MLDSLRHTASDHEETHAALGQTKKRYFFHMFFDDVLIFIGLATRERTIATFIRCGKSKNALLRCYDLVRDVYMSWH